LTPLATGAVRAAAVAVTLWIVAQAGHTMFLCPGHQAWTRAQSDRSAVVLERSVRVARPGDAIFTCETTHRTGPIIWHQDLGCYCAPAALSAEDVGQLIAGSCAVDKPNPQPTDDWGACRNGRCSGHVVTSH
jgi:hypothetical protein